MPMGTGRSSAADDAMAYQSHTVGDRERMLATLGISSVDALFEDIPASVRGTGLDLPEPEPELIVQRRMA